MNAGRPLRVSLLLVALAWAGLPGRAQSCKALGGGEQQRIAAYLIQHYRLPAGTAVTLASDDLLPGSCIRKLSLTAAWPRRQWTLFLSADGEYMFPAVFDLAHPEANALADATDSGASLSAAAFAEMTRPGAPSQGAASAPVTMVEFSDFECPFCRRMAESLRTEVLPTEGSRVRLVYRQFPLPMHPWAAAAAALATCAAGENDAAFWRLHDYLFDHQAEITPANLRPRATAVLGRLPGVNLSHFAACLDNPATPAAVAADFALGKKYGVRATPTLFVNGIAVKGAVSAAALERVIQEQAIPKRAGRGQISRQTEPAATAATAAGSGGKLQP